VPLSLRCESTDLDLDLALDHDQLSNLDGVHHHQQLDDHKDGVGQNLNLPSRSEVKVGVGVHLLHHHHHQQLDDHKDGVGRNPHPHRSEMKVGAGVMAEVEVEVEEVSSL
jgi:hypothetical protein